jgi:hypothetical protein
MKKIDLVHTTILIIALLAGYAALGELISLLSLFSYATDLYYMREGFSQAVYILISFILYAVSCLVLIRKGRHYASVILKDEPGVFLIYAALPPTNLINKRIVRQADGDS